MRNSSFSKRKAAIDIAPTELLGLVLGVMVVLALFYLGAKFSGILIGKQELDSTINNFNVMVKHANSMLKDRDFAYRKVTYAIDKKFILVGFSYTDNNQIMRSRCSDEAIGQSKPVLCEGKACLCIYENTIGSDFDGDKENVPLTCNKFDEKLVFLAPLNFNANDGFSGDMNSWSPNYYPEQSSYESLVVYGNGCNTFGSNFGIKEMYLEKFRQGDNIFIYMAPYSNASDSELQKRMGYMKAKYGNLK